MAVTYRGQPVEYAVHHHVTDTYSLVAPDGECLAEQKAREFLSLPNRQNLEVRSGGYRTTRSKNKRGANGKPGQTGRDDPFFTFDPGASAGSISAATIAAASRQLNKQLLSRWIILPGLVLMDVAEKPKPPLKREGVVAGEIVGYRCWRVEKGWLRSVYQSDVWKPGEVLAGRELGDWDSRGIHAWKDSGSKEYHDYIRSYLTQDRYPFVWAFINGDRHLDEVRPAMVTGTVFLWGDVVEHERGWRAEFARVRSLDWLYPDATMMGREQQALDDLRKLYGIKPS